MRTIPQAPSDSLPDDDADLTLIHGGATDGFAEVALDGEDAARPGSVAAQGGQVIAAGPTDLIKRRYGTEARHVVEHPDRLLLPGFVNAHTHLELTTIGPKPYGGDFIGWVKMLREHWPGGDEPFAKQASETWFAWACAEGAKQSREAGVQAVGDITRFDGVATVRRDAGLDGVSFIEVFGMGDPWDADGLARIADAKTADGFQPHAPYSAGPALFDTACASGRPVSCHLAETLDEARFIAEGDGPFLDLLQTLDKWSPDFAPTYGQGLSPVRWMEPYLRRAPWLLAHCNYVDDADIALLAETSVSVAYCPLASAYFGHHATGPGHRYRDLLEAGVNVCLGTDSIVCQPPDEAQPLGILPQMRFLHRRDNIDPALLLRIATVHGRNALQIDHAITRLATVDFDANDNGIPLTQVMRNDAPVQAIDLGA